MEYFVIAPDGSRYGPADAATLSQWARENRVTASSVLEGTDGIRYAPNQIPGLVLPAPGMQSGGMGAPGVGTPGYGPTGSASPGYAPYPHDIHGGDNGQQDITKAWVFGAIGLLCCPIVFSTMGIVYANKASQKGHPNAKMALVFSIVTLILGIIIGVLFNPFRNGFSNRLP